MKLLVDIPENVLDRVREVVRSGNFDDPGEFVLLAIENQIQLEKTSDQNNDQVQTFEGYFSENQSENTSSPRTPKLELKDYNNLAHCQPPDSDRVESGPLWGQYNRILPVKIVVRRLANDLVDNNTESIDLAEFHEEAAQDARHLGRKVKKIDDKRERGRGNKLASGLPVGSKKEKSLDRFRDQFIGDVNKEGNLRGATPALRFVDIDPNEKLCITKSGLTFAGLRNPIIDESIRSESSLSEEERRFYLRHVEENVPAEFEAMNLVAKTISSGVKRPQSITEQLIEINPEWSESQRDTIRIGLISRMFELNLVDRNRVGQRGVEYELTHDGQTILEGGRNP